MLRAADLLVSPTRYEPYSRAIHEPLCRGLPVLVSATAGGVERLPRSLDPLLLPDPEDANDLAARLRAWRASPDAFRAGAAQAGDALRAHGWDEMAREIREAVQGAGR